MEPFIPGIEVRVASKKDLWQVLELANRIFPAAYREILVPEQIDYMMHMMYREDILSAEMDSGHQFLIIYYQGKAAGYASYSRLASGSMYKLHKIYLDNRLQGRGLGKWLLMDVLYRVKAAGGEFLRLNVNRHNKARGFYENMGFSIVREEKLDIGGGYYMDDLIMEIRLTPNA